VGKISLHGHVLAYLIHGVMKRPLVDGIRRSLLTAQADLHTRRRHSSSKANVNQL
jgi:hypothetical protein